MIFKLPALGFELNVLEPYIDRRAMRLHYTKHHATYLRKFNKIIFDTDLETKPLTSILAEVSKYTDSAGNYGGGVNNHAMFWKILTPANTGLNDIPLADAITKYFGTIDKTKEVFSNLAASHVGSGLAWLVKGRTVNCW